MEEFHALETELCQVLVQVQQKQIALPGITAVRHLNNSDEGEPKM